MAFSVVFVCTANICRSAMAERLMRAALDPALPVAVSSAGVHALVGHAMDERSERAVRALGADAAGHVSRQVTAGLVEAADLVLSATSLHRSAAVQLAPRAFRRVFTLLEFVRLGAGLDRVTDVTEDALRARVAEVAAQRGTVALAPPGADDIDDPFRSSDEQMQASAVVIRDAVLATIATLGLAARPVSTA